MARLTKLEKDMLYNRFDGCYNLSEEQQLLELAADGDRNASRILDLMRENAELRARRRP